MTSSPPDEARGRNLYVVIGAVMIAMLLASLDNLILGTAMPSIVGDLGGLGHLSWVVTAYTLATAVSTPVWGKLGDMYGRKGAFLTAIVIFLTGSALAGLSQDMTQLIGFRAVQGLGAGGLMVGALAIISSLVPPREQGRYQGMISGIMGLAMIAGPLAGGAITDHLGWRWCFYVNLPLGALALFMVGAVLHLPKRRAKARIDYLGVVLLATAISSIVLVTTWGGSEYAWTSGVIAGLAALAVAAAAGFVFVERRAAEPVLPLTLFRNANFTLVTIIGFVLGFAMFGAMTYLPLFQQSVQGASATNAGLLGMPLFLAMVAVNVVAGPVITRTGRYKVFIVAGAALLTTGLALLSTMDTGTGRLTTGVFMALVGAGIGCLMQTVLIVTLQSVEPEDLGVGSSTATLSRTIGGSVGVSIVGALFAGRVHDIMAERGGAAGAAVTEGSAQLDAAGLDRLPAAIRDAYEHAVAGGIHQAFLVAAGVGILAFVLAWFVREVPLVDKTARTPEAEEAVPEAASI
ncbi:MDR family MFS transporter [Actinomadura rubrisoli]|uniref:DHA2 family efflux MFS transporter permease subunit n=1 Tax=Actinomadura rubrisoli TaxID=2530368 RepID=A0A4R5BB66_9ACTN|nr:MDR family MFS transporter [Actinomadura rubrisoli]TDD80712.1 DHA2 family efflux MFS transporter permease subunit [Actinomadura rubrisoli]